MDKKRFLIFLALFCSIVSALSLFLSLFRISIVLSLIGIIFSVSYLRKSGDEMIKIISLIVGLSVLILAAFSNNPLSLGNKCFNDLDYKLSLSAIDNSLIDNSDLQIIKEKFELLGYCFNIDEKDSKLAILNIDEQGYNNRSALEEVVKKEGFKAVLADKVVFSNGGSDIADVCRNDATCSGIVQCSQIETKEYTCEFRFTIYLTESAAQRSADITSNLSLDETGKYLSDKLYLYIGNKEFDSLLIGSGLKGQATTQISIQGIGTGNTENEALQNARDSMKRLQTIILLDSLSKDYALDSY